MIPRNHSSFARLLDKGDLGMIFLEEREAMRQLKINGGHYPEARFERAGDARDMNTTA